MGGFSRLATAVEEIREEKEEEGEPVLLFNGGDFLGGAAYGWLAPEGHASELNIMREIGYDAAVIGNHEYDYGPEVLAEYLLDAGYPDAHQETAVLASNTQPPEDYPLEDKDLYRENALFELENGLTLGTFGLIGRDAIEVTADTGAIEFTDQHQAARRQVEELNEAGADVVVALTHSGVPEDQELAQEVEGIDVIVGGHCHTALYQPIKENDTIIVQADSLLKYLGKLELTYLPRQEEVQLRTPKEEGDFLLPIDQRFPPHPEIEAQVERYTEKLNQLIADLTGGEFDDIREVVARSDFDISNQPPLEESPAGNFITDGMRLITEEITGERVDLAVQANGSIRGSIQRGTREHSQDDISFYDITEVIGLGYGEDGYAGHPIVSAYLTGEEVWRVLELAALLEEAMGDTYFLQLSGVRFDYQPNNASLFTIPFLGEPLPTGRAVEQAELYRGEGKQPPREKGEALGERGNTAEETAGGASSDFVPLERDDQELYRLVTDAYILSFLPMVGDLVPWMEIQPRDQEGNPVDPEDFSQLIVRHQEERELKVWETVVKYAASQPEGEDGKPRIEENYQQTSGRINPVAGFPLLGWTGIGLLAAAAVVFLLLRRRKKRTRIKAYRV